MVVVLVPMGHGSDGPMVMGLGYGAVFLMDCGSWVRRSWIWLVVVMVEVFIFYFFA